MPRAKPERSFSRRSGSLHRRCLDCVHAHSCELPMLKSIIAAAALAAFGTAMQPAHAAGETLHLLGRTALPGYQGDFDHLAADVKGERLFLAGEDGGTLEVFDLRSGTHLRSVGGLQTPHAIH